MGRANRLDDLGASKKISREARASEATIGEAGEQRAGRLMKVTVVGAGIVGLSAAHSLVEAGCDVVVLDAGDIPNPRSASYDLSRMMRLQYGPQSGYARLAKRALISWAKLQSSVGVQLYHPTGVCVWPATASAWTDATRSALRHAGVASREVSPE